MARRIQRFGSSITRIGTRIAGLGAALTTPFILATRIFQTTGDALDKMSRRTGFTASALSELDFAAQQSGTSLGTVERGIKSLQKNIIDLGRGLATPRDAFNALGLSFAQLKDLSPEDQFNAVVLAIGKIEDPTERAARAMQVFGRAGQELVPLLAGGTKGITALRREARELGLSVSGDTATKAAKLSDAIGRIKFQAKVAAINIGASLAPALTKTFNLLTQAGRAVIDFTRENGRLIAIVAAVSGGVLALGGVLVGLGVTAGLLGFALAGLITAVVAVAAVLVKVAVPAAIAIAAIAAVTVAVFKFTTVFQRARDYIGNGLKSLQRQVEITLGGVRDALAGEGIAAAARILVVGVKLVVFRGLADLTSKAVSVGSDMLNTLGEVAFGVAAAFSNAWAFVAGATTRLSGVLSRVFAKVLTTARSAFALIVFGAKSAITETRALLDPTFTGQDASRARLANASDLSADLAAAKKSEQTQIGIINSVEAAALSAVESERQARLAMIADMLEAQRRAVRTGGRTVDLGLQIQIAALEAEQKKLLAQAAEARRVRDVLDGARNFFLGSGERRGLGLFDGLAEQVQQAAIAARGVTSSFNIRSLDGGGGDNDVKQIGQAVADIRRDIRDVAQVARGGGSGSGLVIV